MLDVRMICAVDIIDPEIEGHYGFVTSLKTAASVHRHDFYEFFLVTGGSARHLVNGKIQLLEEGSLVFIRPADAHCYEGTGPDRLNFINLAFSRQTALSCFKYLEGCLPHAALVQEPLPPHVRLSGQTLYELTQRLQAWNTVPLTNKRAKRAELRMLLIELFVRCLSPWPTSPTAGQPFWFSKLLADMSKRENLTVGLPALLALSGKSHEHLCREFRRHTGLSPTAYINGLRLEYAANLLVNSNLSVLDIMLESGYENLSHFNHRFHSRYGCSPRTFRQDRRRPATV